MTTQQSDETFLERQHWTKCSTGHVRLMRRRTDNTSTEPHKRLAAQVSGRVQGVGFRHFVRGQARGLGLSGWVRNEPDGSVRLVAEGPEADLMALLAAVRRGPAMSYVIEVEATWEAATDAFEGFSVRF